MIGIDLEYVARAESADSRAMGLVAGLLEEAGWRVEMVSSPIPAGDAFLRASRGSESYAVEVQAASEGRSDRLLPLWALACLRARRIEGGGRRLAVVVAPRVSATAAEQVLRFAEEYAPDMAVGIVDHAGLRRFRGPGLEALDVPEGAESRPDAAIPPVRGELFSDLNQWMLKVLLAPEVPESLLSAPRGRYRNAQQLADAAEVSPVSAYRLVRQLTEDGHLDRGGRHLRIVRREALFDAWRAAAVRRTREMPMRFLFGGDAARVAADDAACLGLFAAADALGLGFVHGVPPHVLVPRLDGDVVAALGNLVPAGPGETPDLLLRQAAFPRSVFRGRVKVGDAWASDVVQVWLDVSGHPARGSEQADVIRRRVLDRVIRGEGDA